MASLSPERLAEIKKISALPKEQQAAAVESFLKKLSPEEMKTMQEMQGGAGNCIFCLIAEGKVENYRLYTDDIVVAVLDIRPATKGHTLIFPKRHVQLLQELPAEQIAHVFLVAEQISMVLFSSLKCAGTSIVVNQGSGAGQTVPHAGLQVIPRYEGDGLNFSASGEQAKKEELQALVTQLRSAIENAANSLKPEERADVVVPDDEDGNSKHEDEDFFDERIP